MTDKPGYTLGQHLNGDIAPDVRYYPEGIESRPSPYGSVGVDAFTVFVNSPAQAQALADAYTDLADRFGADPIRRFVMDRALIALAEYTEWQATPVTGTAEDGHPRQQRYAEFCGRFAVLLAEFTGAEK